MKNQIKLSILSMSLFALASCDMDAIINTFNVALCTCILRHGCTQHLYA